MRKIPFYDQGEGGGAGTTAVAGDPKAAEAEATQKMIASLAAKVKEYEAKESERTAAEKATAAKMEAEKSAAERAEALKRGEHEKLLAEKEAALKATTDRLTAAEQREAARIARFEAAAKDAAEKLAPEMKAVVDAIPDPEARLAAIRTLSAEKVPVGAGPRNVTPPPVIIPANIVERASEMNVKPESLYAVLVKSGQIKPATAGAES